MKDFTTTELEEFDKQFGKYLNIHFNIKGVEGWDSSAQIDVKSFILAHDKRLMQKIKEDLIKIADAGEYEDLRREVEWYFNND